MRKFLVAYAKYEGRSGVKSEEKMVTRIKNYDFEAELVRLAPAGP